MRPRLVDAVIFVLGAAVGVGAALYPSNGSVLIWIPLGFLCPGFLVGGPLAWHVMGEGRSTPGIEWGFVSTIALINGLLLASVPYLTRFALKRDMRALLPVIIGAGLWIVWYGQVCAESWPRPEPPPAPVDLTSPLAGRWEGVTHGTSDVPTILVCHPRTDGTLDGFYYVGGWLLGPLEEGTFGGDSLHFGPLGSEESGHFDRTQMTLWWRFGGSSQLTELRFASKDTARLALPSIDTMP